MSRFSIIPTRAIEDERFSLSHLRVLNALGRYTDKHGWCFPSMSTIADLVKVSRQMVSRCVGDLEEWGYLEIHRRTRTTDGGQTSNGYRVLFDVGDPQDLVANVPTPPQPVVAPPLQPLTVAPPATSGGCTINAPVKDPPVSVTAAGFACRLLREAGCMSANPSHPKLLEALQAGVTPETLADTAREFPGKPMAYIVTTAHRRLTEGATNNGEVRGGNSGPNDGGGRRKGESIAEWVERTNRALDARDEAGRQSPAPSLGTHGGDLRGEVGERDGAITADP